MPMKLGRSSVSHVLKGMSVQQLLISPLYVAVGLTAVEECQLAPPVPLECLQITQVQLNVRVALLDMHAKLLAIDQWLARLEHLGMF